MKKLNLTEENQHKKVSDVGINHKVRNKLDFSGDSALAEKNSNEDVYSKVSGKGKKIKNAADKNSPSTDRSNLCSSCLSQFGYYRSHDWICCVTCNKCVPVWNVQ